MFIIFKFNMIFYRYRTNFNLQNYIYFIQITNFFERIVINSFPF